MTADRKDNELLQILHELRSFPRETEWVEFKHNNDDPQEIGAYISALSNSAALLGKIAAWLVWGVDDATHDVIGTTFRIESAKVGNEELENWLLRQLRPKINFRFHSLQVDDKPVVMLEICAASQHPVQFTNVEYIRVGSYKKHLKDFPEKERELWRIFDRKRFEEEIAAENVTADEVLSNLSYPDYFDKMNLPLPDGREAILAALEADELIARSSGGGWNITNLGAVLFAKRLADFHGLRRKAVRVIQYKGENKLETMREQEGGKGYASGFDGLIEYMGNLIPSSEVIVKGIRKEVPMFPLLAVRELIVNAVIHQDFRLTGTSVMVELFSNRIEITNPGLPLVRTERFLDSPPKSRNEALASFMRRIGICEERGSGIDKVVLLTEAELLPAPIFETTDEHTRVTLLARRPLPEMEKDDRIRACYFHASLKYIQKEFMTNASLRNRFGLGEEDRPTVSRIIAESTDAGVIQCYDKSVGPRARRYIPFWAS